ncbi:MAG: MATE family efflux transporter [Bacteroidota bacterium]
MGSLSLKNSHVRETVKLAFPLVIAQVGHIVTGMVDNMFLGKFFGETEQAAGILSNQIFTLLLVFLIGVSFAITPLVNKAYVTGDHEGKISILKNSFVLISGISVLLFVLLYFSSPFLYFLGQPKEVVDLTIPFFKMISFSIIPVSFFFVCKQYAEGLNNTRNAMYISLFGNLINILLNYGLIRGIGFLPEMGYMGSSWATFFSRCFMGFLFMYVLFYKNKFADFKSFKKASLIKVKLKAIFFDGISSGSQFLFEVAAFVICALMCGSFGKASIDAHGISMGMAAFTYMFSSGISGAATIRVSNFNAMNNREELRNAGITSFILSIAVMLFFGAVFFIFNRQLPYFFTSSKEVGRISSGLLIIAAIFQLFDGVQVTGLGVLRGLGDFKFPTIFTFVGYWLIAIPLAWLLGFYFDFNIYGVWVALCVGLIFVAVLIFFRFQYLSKSHK